LKKWIDTHAHYGHKRFGRDPNNILEEMSNCVERIIQIDTNTKSNLQAMQLVSAYDYVYGMLGYFPTDTWELEPTMCDGAENNWLALTKQLTNSKVVGIGEIGLDYNWNCLANGVKGEEARKVQKKWFRKQLDLAKELGLPVSIHSRDAEEDTLKIFDEYETIKDTVADLTLIVDKIKSIAKINA
jgi:TatD DNase family protein